MGPVEQSFRVHAQEVHSRVRNTQPPGLIIINQRLQALVDSLREQLAAANAKIERLQPKFNPHPVHMIIALVCKTEKVTKTDLVSARRIKSLCSARHIAYYLSATTTTYSLPQIGRYFGNRDHTTIMHGRDKVRQLRANDPVLDVRLKWYEEQIGADRKGA